MTVTLQQLVDRARIRHWSFNDVQMPEGALVTFANERQRALLLLVIRETEALIGESKQINTQATGGTVVALDDNGVPYYADSSETGYGIAFDDDDVPYIDMSSPVVVDPFGTEGSNPGIPLPANLLRLISAEAITTADATIPREIVVMEQRNASAGPDRMNGLRAFINGLRLIPIRVNTSDVWSSVTAVRLGVVLVDDVTALADEITLPDACTEALTAGLAEFLSTASRDCPQQDKARFERQRKEAEALLIETAESILSAVQINQVVYRP